MCREAAWAEQAVEVTFAVSLSTQGVRIKIKPDSRNRQSHPGDESPVPAFCFVKSSAEAAFRQGAFRSFRGKRSFPRSFRVDTAGIRRARGRYSCSGNFSTGRQSRTEKRGSFFMAWMEPGPPDRRLRPPEERNRRIRSPPAPGPSAAAWAGRPGRSEPWS